MPNTMGLQATKPDSNESSQSTGQSSQSIFRPTSPTTIQSIQATNQTQSTQEINELHQRYIKILAGAAIAQYQTNRIIDFNFLHTNVIHLAVLEILESGKSYLLAQSLESAKDIANWMEVIVVHKPIQLMQYFIYLLWSTKCGHENYRLHCFNQGQLLFEHFKKDIYSTFLTKQL